MRTGGAHKVSLMVTPTKRGKEHHRSRAGSTEKETSWAVPRFLGITQRVPIAVIVALTGEHFGFVMLAFLVSAFAVATIGETSFAGDASLTTGEARSRSSRRRRHR